MNLLKFKHHHHLRRLSISAAAVRQDTTTWISAPLVTVSPAAESLFHVSIDVSDNPDVAASYTNAGQYLQLRVPDSPKPLFLAIASPPEVAAAKGVFEFLVKSVAGSTAELLCGLRKGDVVDLTAAMGKGFDIDEISPSEEYKTVLIFATGSGISPIRSLIESGFDADKRSDVRLYYGARNLQRMAYQDRFKEWESSGVEIVPVLSQPDGIWTGGQGYVQVCTIENLVVPDDNKLHSLLLLLEPKRYLAHNPQVLCFVDRSKWPRRSLLFLLLMEYPVKRF